PLLHDRQRLVAPRSDQLQRPRRHRRRRARALGHAGALHAPRRAGRRRMGIPSGQRSGVIAKRRAVRARRALRSVVVVACLAVPTTAAAQQTHILVISGTPGDEEHAKKFQGWVKTFVDTAKKKESVPDANITVLADKDATRGNVEKAFADLSAKAKPNDGVFVLLIGHGSYDGRVAAFNLMGPDLSADDFARLLGRFPTARGTVVNTTSASGAFL